MAKRRGSKWLQARRNKAVRNQSTEQQAQRQQGLRLKSELQHKLEVQFTSADAVEIEIINPDLLPLFVMLLDDPSISNAYDWEQVSESLFIFRQKAFM